MAPAAAETMDELYAKARPEKAVVFYSGGPVAPYEAFAREFEQRFPDLKVSITGGFSNVLNEKINTQLQARKLEVDMAFFQTLQDFVAWKKQGVLLSFKPEGFEQIAPVFRDPDGAFTTPRSIRSAMPTIRRRSRPRRRRARRSTFSKLGSSAS